MITEAEICYELSIALRSCPDTRSYLAVEAGIDLPWLSSAQQKQLAGSLSMADFEIRYGVDGEPPAIFLLEVKIDADFRSTQAPAYVGAKEVLVRTGQASRVVTGVLAPEIFFPRRDYWCRQFDVLVPLEHLRDHLPWMSWGPIEQAIARAEEFFRPPKPRAASWIWR